MPKRKVSVKNKPKRRTKTSGIAAPTAAQRAQLKRAGVVVLDHTVPLGQKSTPVDPALGTSTAGDDVHEPHLKRDPAGRLVSSSTKDDTFDSLLDLVDSIRQP